MNVTREFWRAWAELPPEVQEEGRATLARLKNDPGDPLAFKRHVEHNIWSARLANGYRALAVVEGPRWLWFRIVAFEEGRTILAAYSNWPEAEMMRSMLDSFGVDADLVDENTVRADWLYSNMLGGVKLRVPNSQAAVARALLVAPASIPDQADQLPCPSCGSRKISMYSDRQIGFASILVVGFPIMGASPRWRCEACGHTWAQE